MRRTEVNVFLVAMAILPFLQNMLLNIGTGRYTHVCMYTVYIILRQNFRDNFFRHFRNTLAQTVHYIPKVLRKGNPFHGPFAQLSYIIYGLVQVCSDLYQASTWPTTTIKQSHENATKPHNCNTHQQNHQNQGS